MVVLEKCGWIYNSRNSISQLDTIVGSERANVIYNSRNSISQLDDDLNITKQFILSTIVEIL